MKATLIILRLLPAIRIFAKAVSRRGPGGKKITPEERKAILGALVGELEAILDEYREEEESK